MFNFNKKDANQDPISGGGITANYKDALKFGSNYLQERVNKIMSEKIEHPVQVLMRVRSANEALVVLVDVIAFVYGNTANQVENDLKRTVSK